MRIQISALLAVAALSLAACGGDDETPAAAAADGPDASTRQAMADFAECMRENGIDFPDPGSGERGAVRIDGSPEKLREAEEACADERAKIKPPELSEEEQKKMREAALANSRCMREHGIDFPDPQFGEGGRMQQRIGGPGSNVDPNSQKFKDAMTACQKDAPGGMTFGGGPDDGDGK